MSFPGAAGEENGAGGRNKTGGRTADSKEKLRKKILKESRPLRFSTDEDDPNEFILSRFVINPWGQQLGESIGVDGSNLIMKKKLKFYSIPLRHLRERGAELVLVKKIDWAKALALGEKWRKQTLELPSPEPLLEKAREIQRGEGQKSTPQASGPGKGSAAGRTPAGNRPEAGRPGGKTASGGTRGGKPPGGGAGKATAGTKGSGKDR